MPPRTAVFAITLSAALQAAAQPAGGGSRVEDEASRPMRMILEAAKIKSRARAVEAPPAKPAAVVPRAPSEPAPVAAAPSTPAPTTPPAPGALPQSAVATVEAAAAPRAAMADPAPAPVPRPGPLPAEPPSEPLQPLQLVNLVEPVTPRALLGKLRGEIRVDVAFTVAADGAVSDATVRSSSHPQMNAAVLEAVSQWRYEPIGSPREHAVQVVLRPGS